MSARESGLQNPIVVSGMHRSGTTLVAGELRKAGVFFGKHLDPNYEDYFFLRRNEWLLRRAGGAWDRPEAILDLLSKPELRAEACQRFAREVNSPRFARFTGLASFVIPWKRSALLAHWGWKDPRAVFTLPLWSQAFPGARLIYLRRNGVDVAASLRERARAPGQGGRSLDGHGLSSRLRWAWQEIEFHQHYLYPSRELTLQTGFELWEQYVAQGEKLFNEFSGPKLALAFEDLALDVDGALERLAEFAGLKDPKAFLNSWRGRVNSQRAGAFRSDPELCEFYASVKHSPWMSKLGYSSLL